LRISIYPLRKSNFLSLSLNAGDIFAKIAGETVADVSDMRAVLEKSETAVKARIYRKDRWLSITLHLE
jgi:hypothetical protein